MKKLVVLFVGFNLALSSLSFAGSNEDPMANRMIDAMGLAIQHFNNDHSKNLSSNSQEFEYMYAALESVATALPQLQDLHGSFRYGGFSSVYREDFAKDPSEYSNVINVLTEIQNKFKDCASRTSHLIETDNSMPGKTSIETTDSYSYRLKGMYGYKDCSSNPVMQKLLSLGIGELWAKDVINDYKMRDLTWGFATLGEYRDMVFILNQLKMIPETASWASTMKVGRPAMGFGGAETDIAVTDSTGKASLSDSVTFTYTQSWGDCPSGCYAHHYWKVKAVPTTDAQGDLTFNVTLISESGDPLQ